MVASNPPSLASLGGASNADTFITQTPAGDLSAEQAMSALATGLVKNTTATGVQSIAAQGVDYYAPGGTDVAVADGGTGASNAAGALSNLGGQPLDADLTQIAGFAKTKGNIIVSDGTNWQVLAVGADGRALVAASGQATGLQYANIIGTYKGKDADESVTSSTTLQNDDDFFFTVEANTRYFVIMVLFNNIPAAGTGGGFKCGWTLPAGATALDNQNAGQNAYTLQMGQSTGNMAWLDLFTGDAMSTGSLGMLHCYTLEIGANAGTAQFQWAQQTSDADATTINKAAFMLVWTENA